ncbi:MAG TPA: hypothetical protein VGU71_22360 [Candidatus Dormibacteraeota bacterium]|nr:hypothetical protein [Candidatus Dormibacteraeota bacterium]
MDPDRWPDLVRDVVAEIKACPRCAVPKADGLMITVEYQPPMWHIRALCVKCALVAIWNILGPQPRPASQPEAIPLPEWVKALNG